MLEEKRDIEDILCEIGEKQREFQEGMKELREGQRKTKAFVESVAKAAEANYKSIKEASGNFDNKWGEFMESLVQGDLVRLFQKQGIQVEHIYPNLIASRPDKSRKWEYDLVAVNGCEIIVIEVKTTLKTDGLDRFLNKLSDFKSVFPIYKDKIIYGAVAYLGHKEGVPEKAQASGLFTVEALGATEVAILTNPKDFKPKAF